MKSYNHKFIKICSSMKISLLYIYALINILFHLQMMSILYIIIIVNVGVYSLLIPSLPCTNPCLCYDLSNSYQLHFVQAGTDIQKE